MSRKLLDLWVGFFVVLGFAALLFLALRVGNVSTANFAETYQLTAKFDNIGGLKVRGPVKSAGVVVGRVAEIRLDPGSYEAHVTLTIDGRYQFPKDTFASILTAGLLGDLLVKAYEKGDKSIDDALSMLGVAPQQQTTQERENPALEAAPTAEPQQPEQASNIPS